MKNIRLNKAFNLWFTGLPSSGKSTTAEAVALELKKYNINTIILDGDILRKGLNSDLGFSKEDREENNRRTIHVSEIIVKSGIPVLTAFISPYSATRRYAKEIIPNFIEVYVDTSIDECIKRDVKGLYAKAKAGEIKNMTGIDDEYQIPLNPDLVLDTINNNLSKNIDKIIKYLVSHKYLNLGK
jgi:adenylylsulfate kinase